MSLLNIAFFVSADSNSGTYFRYHNLAVALVQRGHAVTVYSQSIEERRHCREEVREGVQYVLAPSFPLNSYIPFALNPGNIARRFFTGWQKRETRAGHQVFHLFQPFENSAWDWLWQRRRQPKGNSLFVWDWDDLWSGGVLPWEAMTRLQDRWHLGLMEKLERDLPRRADTVTTCSAFLAERARQNGAREVEVIHNGFWPGTSAETPVSRAAARRHFSLDPEAFYLGFTGFTAGEFEWCLDLLARFSGDQQIRFVHCGPEVKEIIAAQPEAVRARIDYLGFLSSVETRRLLGAIDVGLLPLGSTAFNESRLPIKFVEYLAAGLPALCSDIGEVGRLGRKLDGVVLLPSNRQGWVEGCVEVIQELRTHRRTCLPNPQQLQDNFSWPVLAARLETIYLKQHRAPSRDVGSAPR